MEQYNNKLLPHLIGLKNEIQTNPDELTSDAIHQTKEWLHSIIWQLDYIHNSKIPINKTIPDVLYNIFSLAIYDSIHPGDTALAISYVCRHWRISILKWPALWTFIDLDYAGSMVDLFLNRSEDTPLALSWTQRPFSNFASSKSFFESRANLVLPRLCSLTLHISDNELVKIGHVFQNSQLWPLQLRHLDVAALPRHNLVSRMVSLTDILQIDISCLQRLRLQEVNLPWLVFPAENRLTHFTLLYPTKPPLLYQILAVLSCCPLLCELEFGIRGDCVDRKPRASMSSFPKVDLPKLKRLVLELKNSKMSDFDYLQQFSACIKASGSLSEFKLSYDDLWSDQSDHLPSSLNIFGPVPSGTFSHFAGHHYLSIFLRLGTSEPDDVAIFHIMSAPEDVNDGDPLCLSGSCPRGVSFNYSPILDLIHAMPEITHLSLVGQAWEVLDSWNIDVHRAFPCGLDTLEFWTLESDSNSRINELNSLCVGLKPKTLLLASSNELDPEALLGITSNTGIEVLKLGESFCNKIAFDGAITALRQSGVVVVPFFDIR